MNNPNCPPPPMRGETPEKVPLEFPIEVVCGLFGDEPSEALKGVRGKALLYKGSNRADLYLNDRYMATFRDKHLAWRIINTIPFFNSLTKMVQAAFVSPFRIPPKKEGLKHD